MSTSKLDVRATGAVSKWSAQGSWVALVTLALASALSPTAHVQAGACASFQHYTPGFAAEEGATLPADGGVLLVPTLSSGRARPADSSAEAVSLRRGNRPLPSERVDLAPGWFVLRPSRARPGRITAVAGREQRAFVMARASGSELEAPSSPSIRFYPSRQTQTPRGPSTAAAYNSLRLGARAPEGAVGVVVRHLPEEGRPARPDGFALPIETPDQLAFTFSSSSGRCRPNRPGNTANANAQVEVFFVDAQGRVSASTITRVR